MIDVTRGVHPARVLALPDAIALIVGLVIGSGIFKAPSIVAANTSGEAMMLGAWLLGGAVSLVGALCYAELASAYPSVGGDYHFLSRAWGPRLAFLFAWARLLVITTGSIALLAFVFGDYCSRLLPLGGALAPYSAAVYAVGIVVALTGVNVAGVRSGATAQRWLTLVEVCGVLAVAVAGFVVEPASGVAVSAATGGAVGPVGAAVIEGAQAAAGPGAGTFGVAMVFVLLTFGGWSDSAYVSAELRDVRHDMVRALVLSMLAITAIYFVVNLAYLRGLGQAGMAASSAVAADLLGRAWGEHGARLISAIVALAALTSINATIIVGARSNYALGRDWPLFGFLGHWSARTGTPVRALLVQGALAIVLVVFGALTRQGFETMVDYTAPVYWFFFLMVGLGLFRLRLREPDVHRPFGVPLYPLLPAVFCASSAWLLWSSLAYTRVGALVGAGVLLAGLPLLVLSRARGR